MDNTPLHGKLIQKQRIKTSRTFTEYKEVLN